MGIMSIEHQKPTKLMKTYLSSIVDNRRSQKRQMTLMMLWKMLVKIIRSHQLQDGITEELHTLIGAHGQV